MTEYLTKREKCASCGELFVKLVNDLYCMRCYQANYYQTITKKKRKKNKKNNYCYDKKYAWWIE